MKSLEVPAPDLINYVVGVRAWTSGFDVLCSRAGAWLSGPNKAICDVHATHDAPVHSCRCGLYAYHSLSNFETNTIYGDVFGAIMAWGRMCVARDGFRAEYAQVVAIAPSPTTYGDVMLDDGTVLDGAKAYHRQLNNISDAYGVPVVQFHELEEYALNFGDFIPLEMRPGKPNKPAQKLAKSKLKLSPTATQPATLPAIPTGARNPVTSNTMQAQAHGMIPKPAPVVYHDTPTQTFVSGKACIPREPRKGEDFAGLLAFVSVIAGIILLTQGSILLAMAAVALTSASVIYATA